MGMKALVSRIDLLRSKNVDVDVLVESSAMELAKFLHLALTKASHEELFKFDAADEDAPQVREWFRILPIRADDRSIIVWPADRAAIRVFFGDFVDYYDELWYPAADDVWVTNDERSWILELDHEEVFRFFARGRSKRGGTRGRGAGRAISTTVRSYP